MSKSLKVAAGVAGVVALGAAVFMTAMSYVTAAGDETAFGVRVMRRLGVKPTLMGYPVQADAPEDNEN